MDIFRTLIPFHFQAATEAINRVVGINVIPGTTVKFVDAHIHLSDPEYDQKVDEIVEDAKRSNVVALVSNSMNLQTSILSLQLTRKYPYLVYAALGIHPWSVGQLSVNEIQDTVDLILQHGTRDAKVVAVGEIGLDYQYARRKELQDLQFKIFREMLCIAGRLSLPVIIHSRGTASQIMSLLPSYNVRGTLFHWFSGPMELLSQIIDRGYYISEGPPSVYSSRIQEIISRISLTNLLTETDGPVHFWGPFKGKMTMPSFIPSVVKAIAQVKERNQTDIADQILQNFSNFFKIPLI